MYVILRITATKNLLSDAYQESAKKQILRVAQDDMVVGKKLDDRSGLTNLNSELSGNSVHHAET
jgi:hypothetical protein